MRTLPPAFALDARHPPVQSAARLWHAFLLMGAAAMSIHSFINPGAFEPETIVLMSEVFDAACAELQDTGQPQIVLEVIAERIIAAARNGVRDPVRLREAALAGMPRERD
jgi:hypothetical protein